MDKNVVNKADDAAENRVTKNAGENAPEPVAPSTILQKLRKERSMKEAEKKNEEAKELQLGSSLADEKVPEKVKVSLSIKIPQE